MNVNAVKETITTLKNDYVAIGASMQKVNKDPSLNEVGKEMQIKEIIRKKQSTIEREKQRAIEAVDTLQSEIYNTRKANLVNGLSSAAEIQLICDTIRREGYSVEDIKMIVEVYGQNAAAAEAIKAALNESKNPGIKILAADIPTDKSSRTIASLDKLKANLENLPPLDAPTNDMGAAMYKSGASFDSMIVFLEGIEG